MQIGAQLYTVHPFTQTLEGFSETLKKVADIGYKTVQVSGTCAYDADWLAEQLDKNGLTCGITHYDYGKIVGEPEKTVAFHKAFGCKYIGVGMLPGLGPKDAPLDCVKTFIDTAKAPAAKIAKAGGYFMYHNHYQEFRTLDGKLVMDILSESFAPEEMGFTLDTFWVQYAGFDPVEWLNRLKGRTPCVHFKDMVITESGDKRYSPVGHGILDFDAIIETCVKNGVEYAYVEQDDSYGEDPFMNLKKSYDYLTSKGLK